MSAAEIDRTLIHLTHDILQKTDNLSELALIGIRRRGVHLAHRLSDKIKLLRNHDVPVGALDIQAYRDDLNESKSKPAIIPSQIPFSLEGKDVILVDDVLFTGRSIRAALDAIFDHGRARRVRLCVLIDRGHRELPIEATFVGKRITTETKDIVEVNLHEEDATEKVLILEPQES